MQDWEGLSRLQPVLTQHSQVARINLARMRANTIEALEAKVSNTLVTDETTPLQAGYRLGIAHVLALLRKGFVVG